MFIQPHPRHYSPARDPFAHNSASSSLARRKQRLDEYEDQLVEARERLVAWAQELEAREAEVIRRAKDTADLEQSLHREMAALKKRVAIINAAHPQDTRQSEEALQRAAAVVIQRAMRRARAQRHAQRIIAGMKTLAELENKLELAASEAESSGNLLQLEDTLTKLLEQADGITTIKCPELRRYRKAFVRRVMTLLDRSESSAASDSDTARTSISVAGGSENGDDHDDNRSDGDDDCSDFEGTRDLGPSQWLYETEDDMVVEE